MGKLRLFEYAVILHPEKDDNGRYRGDSELIEMKCVMAVDEKAATFKIARSIDADYENDYDRLEIAIRAF